MGVFDKAKDLYKLQKQAKKIKKELKNIHIEAQEGGVNITLDGEQKVVGVKITMEHYGEDTGKLQNDLKEAFNKGTKKAQLIAAEKMKAVMGDMGLPGMG